MTISEVVKKVAEEHQCYLIRPKKVLREKGQPWQYDIKDSTGGKKKGWIYLDAFTASAVLAVFNAISDENKAKFDTLSLPTILDFTWKNVGGARA